MHINVVTLSTVKVRPFTSWVLQLTAFPKEDSSLCSSQATATRLSVTSLMIQQVIYQSLLFALGRVAIWIPIVGGLKSLASSSEVTEFWRPIWSRTDGEELMVRRLSGDTVCRRRRCFTAQQPSRMKIFHARTAGARWLTAEAWRFQVLLRSMKTRPTGITPVNTQSVCQQSKTNHIWPHFYEKYIDFVKV